jgi:hypothetical protein
MIPLHDVILQWAEAKLHRDGTKSRQPFLPVDAPKIEKDHLRGYRHAVVLPKLDVQQEFILWPWQLEKIFDDWPKISQ